MGSRTIGGRLGIYVDAVYRVSPSVDGEEVSTDRAFLLFVCEVGRQFETLVVIGRTTRSESAADYVLPSYARLAPLPHYTNLLKLGEVVRAIPGTLSGMWRAVGVVDVVWVIGPNPFDLVLIGLALLRRRSIALGVRQDTLAYFRARVPSRRWMPAVWGMQAIDCLYRLLARRVPTVVVGEAIASHYGAPRKSVLPVTISLVSEAEIPSAAPERDWSGTIELLTVGRIEREKNPLLLVEALARLERSSPGRYHLTWVGRGPLESDVRALAQRLGIADRISFRGYVPFGEELFDLYRRAHLFVHVSLTEGVPGVIIEAMSLGTPVVATDVGGVGRAVDHGRAALLVPPSDLEALVGAIERMCSDSDLRARLTSRGLTLARATTLESESRRVARFIGREDGTAETQVEAKSPTAW